MSRPVPEMKNGKRKIDFKLLGKIIKLLFGYYPKLMPIVIVCMVASAAIAACPAIFTQNIINILSKAVDPSLAPEMRPGWAEISAQVIPLVIILAALYIVSISHSLVLLKSSSMLIHLAHLVLRIQEYDQ